MTIRAIIKTSQYVQLALLLFLLLCLAWLGRELWLVNTILDTRPDTDVLIDEIRRNTHSKYRHALQYVASMADLPPPARLDAASRVCGQASGQTEAEDTSGPESPSASSPTSEPVPSPAASNASLKALVDIWQVEKGLKPRPQDALFRAGEKARLGSLLLPQAMCRLETDLMERCLEQNRELDSKLEWVVMLAGGLGKDEEGNLVCMALPQPERAQELLNSAALLGLPTEIESLLHSLQRHIVEDVHSRMGEERQTILWTFALVGIAVVNLFVNLAVSTRYFRKRVTRPLSLVGDYAESVASGGEPETLSMKYGDELASMYGSLVKLQGTLSLRIRELKASERASQASSQQAMLSKAQALSSLNMAQKALATQEKFLAQVGREIRQPISEILSMSWQALQVVEDRKLHAGLLRINQSGGALMDIFNRILDVSGFEEDGMRQQKEAFALAPFLELLRQSVDAAASEKGLAFSLRTGKDLPAEIAGDNRHMEETLRILLENAVRHTAAGQVGLEVQRLADSEDGQTRLRFSISDSGPGFSLDEQERLFGTSTVHTGDSGTSLGMGLALARHLVHFMGGELRLTTSPRGSTFIFEVGCTVLVDTAVAQVRPLVLVVEDSPINLEIACEVLEQLGVETMRATDGQEALDAVSKRQPNLILMDIQMPVMDGLTACRTLREQGHSRITLPIIAMTGHADAEARDESIKAGMNAHLEKPLDVQALKAQLERWLPGGLPESPQDLDAHAEQDGSAIPASSPAQAEDTATGILTASATDDVSYIEQGRGLGAVGGNMELYNELLQRFADSYGNCMAEIQAALSQDDLPAVARLVHTVKGVAANLGLVRLTELCKKMEARLPQEPPTPDDMAAFEAAMQGTLDRINEMQTRAGATVTSVSRVLAREHQQGLMQLLQDLPNRLQMDWGGLEAALEAFMPLVQGTPLAADMRALLAAVNNFDVSDATDHTALLRRKLSGAGHENSFLH